MMGCKNHNQELLGHKICTSNKTPRNCFLWRKRYSLLLRPVMESWAHYLTGSTLF